MQAHQHHAPSKLLCIWRLALLPVLPSISLRSEVLLRSGSAAVKQGPKRTSNLEAPIMLLSGHGGEVFSCRFNPDGDVLASGSHDKSIHLWRVFEKECPNFMLLKGTVPCSECSGQANGSSECFDATAAVLSATEGT